MNRKRKIIIEGITEDGRPFRPSDWLERISGSLSTFGNDRRMRYSNYLQPEMIQGKKCLVIDAALQERNAAAFNFLIDFAKGNHLRMHETEIGDDKTDPPPSEPIGDQKLCTA